MALPSEKLHYLYVLGMKIQCDIRWTEHTFYVAKEAVKYRKFFETEQSLMYCNRFEQHLYHICISDLYTGMEYNSHV